jgi:diketogulonate reductase-like aldo/keto reductase
LPAIGFGTFPHQGEDSAQTVEYAISIGYRLFDTALSYGNERGVGEGIRRSGLPRDEIIVMSKLPGRYHGLTEARTSVTESLKNLGVDRIDLYLIHWPLPRLARFVDTWKALIAMQAEGLLGSIGVSNFTPQHLSMIIDATGVVPAVNQIEMHPFFAQAELRAVHDELGIVTESWSPLGRGTGLLEEPPVQQLAGRYDVTPAQLVLRWHIQLGVVPIPMSSNPERQRANLDLGGFELSPEAMDQISGLERGRIWGQHPDEYEEF